MLSPSLFVGAAECFEIAEERMGGVAVCRGCSSYPFFDTRGGEVPGGSREFPQLGLVFGN